jgi:hypothetical protein
MCRVNKTSEIRRNSVGPNQIKKQGGYSPNSNFKKTIKNQKNTIKLEQILSGSGEEIFSNRQR